MILSTRQLLRDLLGPTVAERWQHMRKAFRILALACLTIVILLVIFQITASIMLPKIIRQKLEEGVAISSHGEYHLSIKKVTANIFKRSVGIHNAELQFDTSDHGHSIDSSKVKWRGNIEHIAVSGIDVISFIRSKDISVQEVVLIGSNVEMIRPPEEKLKEDSAVNATDSLQNIFTSFHSVKVGSIITSKTSFSIFNSPVDTLPAFQTKNINVNLKDITFDSITLYSRHRLFDAKNASAIIRDMQFVTSDSLFTLTIPITEFSYHDYSIHIDSLHFSPRCSRDEFLKKIPFEKDYLEIFVRRIDLKNANIKGLLEKKECIASKMLIDSMMVEAYRDKNLPDDRKVKPMPLDLLSKAPFLISLDSVLLHHVNILYIERTCDAKVPGKVWFDDINATLTKVTNDSVLHRDDTLTIHARGLLMGEGKTVINFHFPLFSSSKSFFGSGEVGAMSMKALNPMLEKNAFISAKTGMIKKVEFTMSADAVQSRGELLLMYNDLEVAKLNSSDPDGSAFPQKVISAIANLFLRKNNPEPKSGTRQSIMYWRRDPTRSIFNYVWKTIFSGVKDTFGLPEGKNTTIGTTTCP